MCRLKTCTHVKATSRMPAEVAAGFQPAGRPGLAWCLGKFFTWGILVRLRFPCCCNPCTRSDRGVDRLRHGWLTGEEHGGELPRPFREGRHLQAPPAAHRPFPESFAPQPGLPSLASPLGRIAKRRTRGGANRLTTNGEGWGDSLHPGRSKWSDSLQRQGVLRESETTGRICRNEVFLLFRHVFSRSAGRKPTPAGRFGTGFALLFCHGERVPHGKSSSSLVLCVRGD